VAPAKVPVLITGESGTGKELIARLLHRESPRAERGFIAFDCNAVTPSLLESELFGHERGAFTGAVAQHVGVFEAAHRTTLFLDEISNLPLPGQAKLLRVLQEREFRRLGGRQTINSDFRLITATNADLSANVKAGSFREDLYHRLKVVHLEVPALRARREDIPLLVGHFVAEKRQGLGRPEVCQVSHAALDLLTAYDWPGNIRELEHVVESAMLECTGSTIEVEHLLLDSGFVPPPVADGDLELPFRTARQRALASFERLYITVQMRRHCGSVTATAREAGITTKHIRALMRRHGIERRDFRPSLRHCPESSPTVRWLHGSFGRDTASASEVPLPPVR